MFNQKPLSSSNMGLGQQLRHTHPAKDRCTWVVHAVTAAHARHRARYWPRRTSNCNENRFEQVHRTKQVRKSFRLRLLLLILPLLLLPVTTTISGSNSYFPNGIAVRQTQLVSKTKVSDTYSNLASEEKHQITRHKYTRQGSLLPST